MMNYTIQSVAVFCGSNMGVKQEYTESIKQLANCLVDAGLSVVYGGAKVGLMGVLANQVLQQKGHVTGVIPKSLVDVELAHEDLTALHIVNTMHERKAKMASLADAFIMLPGGPGSLDEFFEMITWSQLGYHSKPCSILNSNGYYDLLLKFLDHAVDQAFMKKIHRDMLIVEENPKQLLSKLNEYCASFFDGRSGLG